jgi:hypothetical protein
MLDQTNEDNFDVDQNLFSLITMFASSAWCQLGKVQNPVSGKIEKDLKNAKVTIDILVMIKNKTNGNLTKNEENILTKTISDLQINYVDELSKSEKQ